MAEEDSTPIPGERAETSTGRGLDSNPTLKRGAVALAIIAFVGFALWSMRGQDKPADGTQPERVVIRQTSDFEPAKEPVQPVTTPPESILPTPGMPDQQPGEDEKLLDAARRAPVIAYGAEKSPQPRPRDQDASNDAASNYVPVGNNPGGLGAQAENEDQRFNRMLTPTQLQGSRAGTLGNRDFIVAMGTSIPCVLETALSSDQPGFTSCVINRDVLSDNGRVVLMEKGTQVVGEYRGGLRRGQKRLFVLWNRAKTPKGVIITLASPATDALGRAGVDGYVDTHWWERFGSAILLSIVGDATSYANSQLQDSDVEADNTTSAGKQAATIAVEQSINIPPTLLKHQGELVSIFVARDLDFSSVYRLRVTEPRNRIYDRAVLGDFSPASTLITK
ncbi:TrbI/VirB10 family protein [Rhizobium leguminosarum]|uniref:type IV secretion system protein VirB10 n=1 Tax=Rhizobium leguminosarum TaxID=384 RepID=UPI00037D4775|nr:type IV secretion system protein VirB10 [Rhizobium leguminosarum]MBY5787599.1 TrbI/VirB10 family protein [Rhizobium leguminosarum]NKL98431.1 type IV secretion system protein VirB10 [Rhizobium leguminosarum bv. viciae]NKM97992.1 type IV secretion system protein VirB10 [Rhizobium leguminosarum bv. viciae]